MALWPLKVACLVLILFLTVVFGLLPVFVAERIRRRERADAGRGDQFVESASSRTSSVISHLNCFSGGIFFATCFVHLFPEVLEQWEAVKRQSGLNVDFPIGELLICAGFFLVLLAEQCAVGCRADDDSQNEPNVSDPLLTRSWRRSSAPGADKRRAHVQERLDYGTGASTSDRAAADDRQPASDETSTLRRLRALLVLIALSVHSLFAGLALGLQTTNQSLWTLFAALAVHKSAVAFTIGLQFVEAIRRTSQVITYLMIFCLMSPIGVSIGTAITAIDERSLALDVSSFVLQGLATGTFIYVTFFEILQKEFSTEGQSFAKILLVLVGFSTICLSKFLEG